MAYVPPLAQPLPTEEHALLDDAPNDDDFHVEFDYATGYDYACCLATTVSAVVTAGLALLCLPCIKSVVRKEVTSQRCKVTSNRVVLESGWLNRSTRYIPLDRIQDVNVREDIVKRHFGITGVEIQTAGVGMAHMPEAYLLAPRDASAVRRAIMQRRDALMFRRGHAPPQHDDSVKKAMAGYDNAVVRELRELKDSVLRIEAQVSACMHARTSESVVKQE